MSGNKSGSLNNPILIESDTPYTEPYASPPRSPDDLTSANLDQHYRPPNPLAQLSMAPPPPLLDLDLIANQPSTSHALDNTPTPSTSRSTLIKATAKSKNKQTKICAKQTKIRAKQNKTNTPLRTKCKCKQPKLKIGALPLNPNTTSLILSTDL